jgi:hypothetical protein
VNVNFIREEHSVSGTGTGIALTILGQSPEKFGEMRVQGDSLGPNKEQLLLYKIF